MSSTVVNDDDDNRYETEEFLVYVDLETKLLDDQLPKSSTKIKFLGIDTDNPIMQLNNQLFKGTFDYSMGTHCFFSESSRPGGVEDECFQELPAKLYDYFAKTDKVLKMNRIFVKEKETDVNPEMDKGEIENLEHLRISKTYAEALNQFLKPGEQPPREIVQETAEEDDEKPEDDAETEDENRMEVEQILIDVGSTDDQSEALSEDSENMKIEKQAQEEFTRLTDPDNSLTKSAQHSYSTQF